MRALMPQLAGHWRIFFVEEPVQGTGPAALAEQTLGEHITLLVPRTPAPAHGFHGEQLPLLAPLLAAFLSQHGAQAAVAWLGDSNALPLTERLGLRSAGRTSNGAAHGVAATLPQAVDAAHFAPLNLRADSDEALLAAALHFTVPKPRLGYCGPIDERLDLGLIDSLAAAHPEWHTVLAGPLHMNAALLPQRRNLHWLGAQPYEHRPYLLAEWRLCLLPFAPGATAQHFAAAHTLEYLAAEKPVVATPSAGIPLPYTGQVRTAAAGPAFVQACEALLAEPEAARAKRISDANRTVAAHTWERVAEGVHAELAALLPARLSDTPRHANRGAPRVDASAGVNTTGLVCASVLSERPQ